MTKFISKEKLTRIRANRERNRNQHPFGRGHVVPGTIAMFESPTCGYAPEEERRYPGQIHRVFQGTVAEVVANGADSWIAIMDDERMINIDWCREIIKRGVPVRQAPKKEGLLRRRVNQPYDFENRKYLNKHPSKYYIRCLNEFIHGMLSEHPRYVRPDDDHLYAIDPVCKRLLEDPSFIAGCLDKTGYYPGLVISKKKFHRVFQSALVQAKVSRRKMQLEQRLQELADYERDMDYNE